MNYVGILVLVVCYALLVWFLIRLSKRRQSQIEVADDRGLEILREIEESERLSKFRD